MASRNPDAIALLKADHRKVEELFEKFEKAKDGRRKRALAGEICSELSVHTTSEEEILYPACKGKVEKDLMNEAYVEYDGAKVLIAELAAGGPGDQFYDAKKKVLSEEIKHHVKEEEKHSEGVFAQLRDSGIDRACRPDEGAQGRAARTVQVGGLAGADDPQLERIEASAWSRAGLI